MDLLTPDLGLFIWNLLAFLILFLILRATAWKPILKSLNEREKGIADSLATAERVRAEMAQLKGENEALLTKAREERAQLLKEARDTRDKIVNEAKGLAKEEAAKIVADAQLADKTEQESYIRQLTNEAKLN